MGPLILIFFNNSEINVELCHTFQEKPIEKYGSLSKGTNLFWKISNLSTLLSYAILLVLIQFKNGWKCCPNQLICSSWPDLGIYGLALFIPPSISIDCLARCRQTFFCVYCKYTESNGFPKFSPTQKNFIPQDFAS
jgi:hypothetical protein